jgi:hypothetical protein
MNKLIPSFEKKNIEEPSLAKDIDIINYKDNIISVAVQGSDKKKDWMAIYRTDQIEWFKKNKKKKYINIILSNKPGKIPALLWLYCNGTQKVNEIANVNIVNFDTSSKHKQLDSICKKNEIDIFPLSDGEYKLYFFKANSYNKYVDEIIFIIENECLFINGKKI